MNKLIVIEGTDCSGKQTQSELLRDNLNKMGYKLAKFGFPVYNSPTGRIVGECYLGKGGNGYFGEGAVNVDYRVAGLYFAADRLYNIDKVQDMLSDSNVVLDRYIDSNLAHQGAKKNTPEEREEVFKFFETLEYDLLGLPKPDIRILLYMPSEYARELKAHREEKPDQHESDENYLKRSEQCYLELAKRNNYVIINCVQDGVVRSIDDIQQELISVVLARL